MRFRVVLLMVAMLLAGGLSLTGCKNVCQKAGEKYLQCWEEHCEANADDERCESRLNNPMANAMKEADSCPNEERAQQIVDQTCEEIINGEGL